MTPPLPRFKAFPPGEDGVVLVPPSGRQAPALGITLFTASKPNRLWIQRLAFHLVRSLGAWTLPSRVREWNPPVPGWDDLLSCLQREVGPFDSFSVYQRRQSHRPGLLLLLTRQDRALAVVKAHTKSIGLEREFQALAAVQQYRPQTFRAPRPLASGRVSDLFWTAQEAVFSHPHRPVLRPPAGLFEEIRESLSSLGPEEPGLQRAHGDLSPWNLRTDQVGEVWLYDWEHCQPLPREADRVYFSATAAALAGAPMPEGLPLDAITYWHSRVAARKNDALADQQLQRRILAALVEAKLQSA